VSRYMTIDFWVVCVVDWMLCNLSYHMYSTYVSPLGCPPPLILRHHLS
jgi:hypothetical protein